MNRSVPTHMCVAREGGGGAFGRFYPMTQVWKKIIPKNRLFLGKILRYDSLSPYLQSSLQINALGHSPGSCTHREGFVI